MLNYLRLERRLRINCTKKWFDDLNDISGWHIHDGEADALAILADEQWGSKTIRGTWGWCMHCFRGAHYWQITCGWPDWRRGLSLKGRMATSCARCDITVSTRSIAESQCWQRWLDNGVYHRLALTTITYVVWFNENVKAEAVLCAFIAQNVLEQVAVGVDNIHYSERLKECWNIAVNWC